MGLERIELGTRIAGGKSNLAPLYGILIRSGSECCGSVWRKLAFRTPNKRNLELEWCELGSTSNIRKSFGPRGCEPRLRRCDTSVRHVRRRKHQQCAGGDMGADPWVWWDERRRSADEF